MYITRSCLLEQCQFELLPFVKGVIQAVQQESNRLLCMTIQFAIHQNNNFIGCIGHIIPALHQMLTVVTIFASVNPLLSNSQTLFPEEFKNTLPQV